MHRGSRVLEFHARACAYRSDAWRCDDHSRFSRIDIANRNHVDLTLRFGFALADLVPRIVSRLRCISGAAG